MKFPSSFVLKRVALVTIVAATISISVSTSIRFIVGVQSDTITVFVRIILPFVIAIPLALVWFSHLEKLEKSYRALLKQANALAQRANLDPLTGLLNRRSFIEQYELAMAHRVGGMFMIVDVDYLKRINDQHGHLAGDEAIIATAVALRSVLGEEALIARIGGDEFCAFMKSADDSQMSVLITQLESVARDEFKSRTDNIGVSLMVSCGYARCKSQQSFKDVLNEADKALYIQKRSKYPSIT